MRRFLSFVFPFLGRGTSPKAPPPVAHQRPYVRPPPPVLGYFTLGLIASIRDHPEEWTYSRGPTWDTRYIHTNPDIVLVLTAHYNGYSGSNSLHLTISPDLDAYLQYEEREEIKRAIDTYLTVPRVAREKAAAEALLAPIKSYFEALGCSSKEL